MIQTGETLKKGKTWFLRLTIDEAGQRRLRFSADRVNILDIMTVGDVLLALARFDVSPNPLMLTAKIHPPCEAMLAYEGCRLGLYVDGALADEEWPMGNLADSVCDLAELPAEWVETWRPPEPPKERDFTWEQGWKPEGGNVSAGDCMPFADGDTFHLFFLKDRRNHQSKWGKGAHQWAHIATRDLVHWKEYPDAIRLTDEAEGSICTGSVIKCENGYRAYYAVRMADGSPAKITYATSRDLIHFEKSGVSFTLEPPYEPVSARDPFIYYDQDEGRYHLLITTSVLKEDGSHGALADFSSADLVSWESEAPLTVFETGRNQPACADLFQMDGLWYLLYRDPQRVNRYFYASGKRGPWIAPDDNLIVDRDYIVPKSAVWKGRILFAGFRKPKGCFYGGGIYLYEAAPDGKGGLRFRDISEAEVHA